ncbi:MAG: hypothetical protein Q8N03_08350 [Ignavibacteria bacterium]|jgi:hypothetical protein|nr:hypothetical protein [Ignavibacteria bacterium]
MKKIIGVILFLGIIILSVGCADDPDPKFRILNDRSEKANVQIKTTGGNTININDVSSGQITDYQTAAEGNVEVTAVIQGESFAPTIKFFAEKGKNYTVVIEKGILPSLRVY